MVDIQNRSAFVVGTNQMKNDIDRAMLYDYSNFRWNGREEIVSSKFNLTFSRVSNTVKFFTVSNSKGVTHALTYNEAYLWDGILFICKKKSMKVWRYKG